MKTKMYEFETCPTCTNEPNPNVTGIRTGLMLGGETFDIEYQQCLNCGATWTEEGYRWLVRDKAFRMIEDDVIT